MDIATTLEGKFGGSLAIPPEFLTKDMQPGHVEDAGTWHRRARERRKRMDKYMWDSERGMYFDYNTDKRERTTYESATTFWALWARIASPRQAADMVVKALPLFEELGGLAAGTERSRGLCGLHRPNRQWDYPYGWAPQQILAWDGLWHYGYDADAIRLVYKWLFMVTKAFNDFNGVVVEKYDVTRPDHPHKVLAEYGNQGSDFKGVPREG
ncbi:hypothetical protein MRB53_038440 [Persea americana]|nr:hypothetical protein MRB53_038440 [Persea americana]